MYLLFLLNKDTVKMCKRKVKKKPCDVNNLGCSVRTPTTSVKVSKVVGAPPDRLYRLVAHQPNSAFLYCIG
ncbi:hypothetical protein OC25_10515 [Pedobacter kyungheensis]|uniref:Uncharacterized protein n=1 Tax=Pedobacter kyungheensis TaxID=1069985 RepID=A0A0C1FM81_9SPHI|nr:hypothetical protein OC25_10515 [Pedobacter kyungheensis]